MSKNPSATALPVPFFKIDEALKGSLLKQLPNLKGRKVLVLGDVGVDEYVMGRVHRISPEAPVPVVEVESEDVRVGLAGNVALNIKALGSEPLMVSVIGQDVGAERFLKLLSDQGLRSDLLVQDPSRPTTRKARIMAGPHHVVRVDYETRHFLSSETEARVLEKFEAHLDQVDCVIVEDYGKGFFTPHLISSVMKRSKAKGKPVYVDPHRSNGAEFYRGASLIKPNFEESLVLTGLTYDDLRDHPNRILEVGAALLQKTESHRTVITRGKEGMLVFEKGSSIQVPTFARKVFDVTGAGDTVISTLALALSAGLGLAEAAVLANIAAGVVVAQIGCVPCSFEELKRDLEHLGSAS